MNVLNIATFDYSSILNRITLVARILITSSIFLSTQQNFCKENETFHKDLPPRNNNNNKIGNPKYANWHLYNSRSLSTFPFASINRRLQTLHNI